MCSISERVVSGKLESYSILKSEVIPGRRPTDIHNLSDPLSLSTYPRSRTREVHSSARGPVNRP